MAGASPAPARAVPTPQPWLRACCGYGTAAEPVGRPAVVVVVVRRTGGSSCRTSPLSPWITPKSVRGARARMGNDALRTMHVDTAAHRGGTGRQGRRAGSLRPGHIRPPPNPRRAGALASPLPSQARGRVRGGPLWTCSHGTSPTTGRPWCVLRVEAKTHSLPGCVSMRQPTCLFRRTGTRRTRKDKGLIQPQAACQLSTSFSLLS